jgi:hypothetical protein
MALVNKATKPKSLPDETKTESSAGVSLKYTKPKILILDLPDSVSDTLRSKGFNVSCGTLGKPYQVGKSSAYQPLIGEGDAPNHTEQEIIVVDLSYRDLEPGPRGEKHRPDDEPDFWGKCDQGFLDPRVRTACQLQKSFDRIHSTGGAFVVFADEKTGIHTQIASGGFNGLYNTKSYPYDVWSFLSEAADMQVQRDHGTEMQPVKVDSPLVRLLTRFLEGSHFTCTLEGGYRHPAKWEPLAVNKFGGIVALARCCGRGGSVIILPQIADKVGFISELFTVVLPELTPHLFPDIEAGKWTHYPEYELPVVIHLISKQAEVQKQAAVEVSALQAKIENERSLNGWMHDLLTGTDFQLVGAVKTSLGKLGFTKLVDVDEERDKEGKARREDLQIHDSSPMLIVDVKGLGGHPADDDAFQSHKHATLRMKEWKRFDVQALTIINHQRYTPPLSRDNKMPFRQEILDFATEMKMGLITSWDLYRLVRSALKLRWSAQNTMPIFYGIGKIAPVPNHYTLLGHVTHVWTGAVSIQLEAVDLKLGDRIAFELDVEFQEQEITSLQVNKVPVETASVGVRVGTTTKLQRPVIGDGMRVFIVKK